MLGSAPLGSLPLAGSPAPAAATGAATYTLVATPGTFAVGGPGGTEAHDYTLGAGTGAFATQGGAAALSLITYTAVVGGGIFTDTPGSLSTVYNRGTSIGTGTFAASIQASNVVGRGALIATGSFSYAGSPAGFVDGYSVQLGTGSFGFSGSLQPSTTRAALIGSATFVSSGGRLAPRAARRLVMQPGVFAATGAVAVAAPAYTAVLGAGALRVQAASARLAIGRGVVESGGQYDLAGGFGTLQAYRTLQARPGVLSLLGAGSVARGRVAAIPGVSATLVGATLGMGFTRRLWVGTGVVAVSLQAGGVRGRVALLSLQPYGANGGQLVSRIGRTLQAGGGVLVLAGGAAAFGRPNRSIGLDPGSFDLAGAPASDVYSSDLSPYAAGLRWTVVSSITVRGQEVFEETGDPPPVPEEV